MCLALCVALAAANPGIPHPAHASSPALQIIDVVNQVVNNIYDDQSADDRKYLPVWRKCQDSMKTYKAKLVAAEGTMSRGTGLIARAMERMVEADHSIAATTKALAAARKVNKGLSYIFFFCIAAVVPRCPAAPPHPKGRPPGFVHVRPAHGCQSATVCTGPANFGILFIAPLPGC